jgi:heterodisulfide reductase subunit B
MDTEKVKYEGEIEVLHGLEVLRDIVGFEKVRARCTVPLHGLKVGAYYGCLLLRPDEAKIDDPENPTILENLIIALGGEPVDFPYKNECCGSYNTVNQVDIVIDKAYSIINNAKSMGAELILTSCPLCEFNLDRRQKDVKKSYPNFKELPTLYFTQLMAFAFGLPSEATRFDLNYISPQPVLK